MTRPSRVPAPTFSPRRPAAPPIPTAVARSTCTSQPTPPAPPPGPGGGSAGGGPAGGARGRLERPGDAGSGRPAESHTRLARDLGRRNRELRQIVVALEATSLLERPDAVVRRAADQARVAFGM